MEVKLRVSMAVLTPYCKTWNGLGLKVQSSVTIWHLQSVNQQVPVNKCIIFTDNLLK